MSRRKRSSDTPAARKARRRRRRGRWLARFARFVFWAMVLAAVFIIGLGFGKELGSTGGGGGGADTLTITNDRGGITVPTRTVVETKVVTRTVRRQQPRRSRR